MKINFSRGVAGSLSYFVEIPEGWGGHQFLSNMENPGRWWGEVLSEIPSVMEYGYFLKLRNNIYVFFTLSFLDYRKTLVSDSLYITIYSFSKEAHIVG